MIIDAGFIGLEFAATARVKGLEVDVIELAPRVMARAGDDRREGPFARLENQGSSRTPETARTLRGHEGLMRSCEAHQIVA